MINTKAKALSLSLSGFSRVLSYFKLISMLKHKLWIPAYHGMCGVTARMTHSGFASQCRARHAFLGRSMIEMLGVLAIIGVLSVGGIAGYAKAMEKHKINKLIQEYNELIAGLIEHGSALKKQRGYITPNVMALGIIPQNWEKQVILLNDSAGSNVFISVEPYNSFYSGDVSDNSYIFLQISSPQFQPRYNVELCNKMLSSLVTPLKADIGFAYVYMESFNESYDIKQAALTGDKDCGKKPYNMNDTKCLKDVGVSDIANICSGAKNGSFELDLFL